MLQGARGMLYFCHWVVGLRNIDLSATDNVCTKTFFLLKPWQLASVQSVRSYQGGQMPGSNNKLLMAACQNSRQVLHSFLCKFHIRVIWSKRESNENKPWHICGAGWHLAQALSPGISQNCLTQLFYGWLYSYTDTNVFDEAPLCNLLNLSVAFPSEWFNVVKIS